MSAVGVFVNPTDSEVRRVVEHTNIGLIQLHGEESNAFCTSMPLPVIKAIPAHGPEARNIAQRYPNTLLLLDTPTEQRGGSGRCFNWEEASTIAENRAYILAGGLTPTNVQQAIYTALPHAVDVASGVESTVGIKDPFKIARFIQAVHEANG